MVSEFYLIIVAFIGLIIGLIIGRHTQEEVKPGREYLEWLRRAFLIAVIIILLSYSWMHPWMIVIGFVIGYFIRRSYLYLGIALASALSLKILLLPALTFLYGFPYGSLMYEKNKMLRRILFNAILFFVPLLLILTPINLIGFMAFSAGALIWELQ